MSSEHSVVQNSLRMTSVSSDVAENPEERTGGRNRRNAKINSDGHWSRWTNNECVAATRHAHSRPLAPVRNDTDKYMYSCLCIYIMNVYNTINYTYTYYIYITSKFVGTSRLYLLYSEKSWLPIVRHFLYPESQLPKKLSSITDNHLFRPYHHYLVQSKHPKQLHRSIK